jgi:hypothetical protein
MSTIPKASEVRALLDIPLEKRYPYLQDLLAKAVRRQLIEPRCRETTINIYDLHRGGMLHQADMTPLANAARAMLVEEGYIATIEPDSDPKGLDASRMYLRIKVPQQ